MSKRKGNPFRLPLMLTREMKLASDRLNVRMGEPMDFAIALKVYRAGLLAYGVLEFQELQSMYQRGKIGDDEALFLIEAGLTRDFRPVKVNPILQATEVKQATDIYGFIAKSWEGLTESNKQKWYDEALLHPSIPGARRIIELCKEIKK